MGETRGIRGPGARGTSSILAAHRLDEAGIPSWLTFTRALGPASWQTAAAVNGTTFIEYSAALAANTPRFHYLPSAGRRMLLVEPARTNLGPDGNFADVAPNDNVPDGWDAIGTVDVDFAAVDTGGPHGAAYCRLLDTAGRGVQDLSVLLGATTQYAASAWYRRVTASGAASVYTFGLNPGNDTLALGAATHDWQRYTHVGTTVGANGNFNMLDPADAAAVGEIWAALPQIEAGAYASTWIPTSGGAGTRAVELCSINSVRVGGAAGYTEFLWCPLYASDAFAAVATLFEWAPGWRLDYDGADDKLKVIVNGVARATSAALTFSALAMLRVSVRYGTFGQRLSVDGVETTDATAWGSPALAPFLGSRAAAANLAAAAYGDLLLAA